MADASYTTKPGDVLDRLTHEYYAGQAGAFEAVLAANPGLAGHGSVLPGGVVITLPALPAPEDETRYTLW